MISASANLELWRPVLVLGVLQAGLYGLLPIAFVLSYRVNRTVAFVHGGIAGACGFLYFVLVYDGTFVPGPHPAIPPPLGLALMVALGAALGGGYGALVLSRRVARLPAMTHTVISLGAMMILLGIVTKVLLVHPGVLPPGPFGDGTVTVWGVVVTNLRLGTFAAVVVLVAALAWLLRRSGAGLRIQAVSDDLEASAWCGIHVRRLGASVHALAGAVAGLAGPLAVAILGPDPIALFQVILRGLAVAVIGGLLSLPIALAGALVLGLAETALASGMFGDASIGRQELLVNAALLALILAVTRARRNPFALLERRAL
jgi:branched-subunit amino acid ABC-type transport system permease component